MALFTYHLGSVSKLHLILGNMLLLVRLDVGPWPQHQVLGLGSQVLVNITAPNVWQPSSPENKPID